ncbi:hypothetical protein [Flammeovirga sp. SJP92]|uniref:hypothetical protein n=1 Tax=Flammeovirga sp. SJP92 TaxID=1775430 RepID=UPI00078990F4|nr:hypothetical protein [Flammeovirga sp. SJP92]KXX67006.1 hypothetical protein AVL50_28955 [Flammeovirga sp. SJP92]
MPISLDIVPFKSIEGNSWRDFGECYQHIYNDPSLLQEGRIEFMMQPKKWDERITLESNQHLMVKDYHLPIRIQIIKYKGAPEFPHLYWLDATDLGNATWKDLEVFCETWKTHETIIKISTGDIQKLEGKKVLVALLLTFLELFDGYLRVPIMDVDQNFWKHFTPNTSAGYFRKDYLEEMYLDIIDDILDR